MRPMSRTLRLLVALVMLLVAVAYWGSTFAQAQTSIPSHDVGVHFAASVEGSVTRPCWMPFRTPVDHFREGVVCITLARTEFDGLKPAFDVWLNANPDTVRVIEPWQYAGANLWYLLLETEFPGFARTRHWVQLYADSALFKFD